MDAIHAAVRQAAAAIKEAEALIVTAGAGMGVDSGLPDFRGPQGFWRAYPRYKKLGLNFTDLANPLWFRDDPALAWGFYGHRFELYRKTTPHVGFAVLRKWANQLPRGAFVFTSNVDGHFQRSGFDEEQIVECHGSLNWLQCTGFCGSGIWPVSALQTSIIDLDEESMRARAPFPACPTCCELARPNVLMFGDMGWESSRTRAQEERLEAWLSARDNNRIVIVECGAGTAVPSVRFFSEQTTVAHDATLIRINVREPHAPSGQIELAEPALAALAAIDSALTAIS